MTITEPLSYAENYLINQNVPYNDLSLTERLGYKNPLSNVAEGISSTKLSLLKKDFDSQLTKLLEARTNLQQEVLNRESYGYAYHKYQQAMNNFRDTATKLSDTITSYSNNLMNRYVGGAVAEPRNQFGITANEFVQKIANYLQKENEFSHLVNDLESHQLINVNPKQIADFTKSMNNLTSDSQKLRMSYENFKTADQKFNLISDAYRKMIAWPGQKQLSPAEIITRKRADLVPVEDRISQIAEKFNISGKELEQAESVIKTADPAALKSVDTMVESGSKTSFINWVRKEFNNLLGIKQDLQTNSVQLSKLSPDTTAQLAKSIQANGPSIANEASKLAKEQKQASPVIERLKDFLFMKDYKNAIKLCEKEPICKSLLNNTYIKYGGIIGASVGLIAALTAYQRKQDREAQEAKFTNLMNLR